MLRLSTLTLALTLTLTGVLSVQADEHGGHARRTPQEWIQIFEEPERAEWQKPDQVVAFLHLEPGQAVADIGAGSGYFTRRFARAVAPGGRALAVDIEPAYLDYIQKRAREEGQDNLTTVLAAEDDPRLGAGSLDLIFICDTLHHIDNRPSYYPHVLRALKPAGRFVVVEFFPDAKLPFGGPPREMRLDPTALTRELDEAGFEVKTNDRLLPYQYILTATPKPSR